MLSCRTSASSARPSATDILGRNRRYTRLCNACFSRLMKPHSERLVGILVGALYSRGTLQARRGRRRHHELAAGDLHHISRGSLRLGGLPNCNVRPFILLSGLSPILTSMNNRKMIYHLVSLNPYKDITLHVSANNPAMVRTLMVSSLQRFTYNAIAFV